MLNWTALFAATIVVIVGALIFWSNPIRMVNRVVFTCSLHIALWLLLLHLTISTHDRLWFRWTCAISAWVPLHFWIVKESIACSPDSPSFKTLGRGWIWAIASAMLSAICFTSSFGLPHPTGGASILRISYFGFNVGILGLYALLFYDAFRTTKKLSGGRRLELHVWLGGGCAMALAILLLMVMSSISNDNRYIRLQPLVVLGFYAVTTLAISTNRIFEARQIFLVGLEKGLLIAVVAGFGYALKRALQFLPAPLAIFTATGMMLWFAAMLSGWLDRKLQFLPQGSKARQAAFDAARNESRIEKLERAFYGILKGWGQTDHALVLFGTNGFLHGSGKEIAMDCVAMQALRHLRWVTPERLAREKTSPERLVLSNFLSEHKLGVAVLGEGSKIKVLIGVGVAVSRRPFTYPQVTQLMELSSIFEGAFERASLSAKAQHAEQLATVGLLGASLAHEIRNPLVSIKTFVQLLPTRHQDPAFRDKFFGLMTEEVARIDRLTEQLLELASPRAYSAQAIELHSVLRTSLELIAHKAADKRVQLLTEFQASSDRAYTDPSAVKQVLLNLCLNAIQAVENQGSDRWVKITTRNVDETVEVAVSDNGPGIAPEMYARLFQPFQSTKSSGFGLGLAICRDILSGLNAGIAVDSPVPGVGATFRVTFPCQHSLS